MSKLRKKKIAAPGELVRTETTVGEYIDFPVVPKTAPFKPNKQYYIEALAEGSMVGIHASKEYPVFFKLFQRYIAYRKISMKLYIRQVKPDLWILAARKTTEPKPQSMLSGDWREHGRYKWYAEQLEKGEQVTVEDQAEATKARRAWMLYTTEDRRAGRDVVIEFKSGKFRLVRSEVP